MAYTPTSNFSVSSDSYTATTTFTFSRVPSTLYAQKSGNWSASDVWYDQATGGNLIPDGPIAGDIVYANGFTITVDVNATCAEVRNDNLGPEKITNGTFNTDVSGWTQSGGLITWDTGRLKNETNSTNASYAYQGFTSVTNATYKVTASFTAGTQSNWQLYIGTSALDASILSGAIIATDALYYIIATNTTTYFSIRNSPSVSGRNYYIDNFSVKQVMGGYFTLANGVTLTANVYAGAIPATGNGCVQMNLNSPNSASIVGSVTGGFVNSAYGVYNSSTGNLNITGNVTGGLSAIGVSNSTGTLTVTGNILGGGTGGWGLYQSTSNGNVNISGNITGSSAAMGTYHHGTGIMTITNSTITGGSGSGVYGVATDSTGTVNITGNVIGGSTTNTWGVNASGIVNITGNVTGGSHSTAYGVYNTSTTNISGTCTGATSPAVYHNSTGTVTITGNVNGGPTPSSSVGARNASTGILTIIGNANGGSSNYSYGAYNSSTGTTNVIGTCTGGTLTSTTNGFGVLNDSTGIVNITGNCTGGASSTCQGAANLSSGIMLINGTAIGNEYGNGYSSVNSCTGVYNAINTGFVRVKSVQFGSRGMTPISGPVFIDTQPTSTIQMRTSALATKNFYLFQKESKRNVLTYTEDFTAGSSTGWSIGGNTTKTANYAIAPDGTFTATRFACPAGTGTWIQDLSYMITTTDTYTFSVYIKNNGGSNLSIGAGASGTGNSRYITTITPTSTWIRYSITFIGANWLYVSLDNINNTSAVDCLIWGAQLEVGSTPTTYQPVRTTWTAEYPIEYLNPANVRKGITYANGYFTGTMNVPPAATVENDILVDNTTGTGKFHTSDVWSYPDRLLTIPVPGRKKL